MTSNVACSTPGCTNPVVGQCGGYNSKCGRFYCTEHSTSYSSGAVLCSVCAERNDIDWKEQQRQAEIQRIYEDYLETAKQIKNPGCFWQVLVGINVLGGIASTFDASTSAVSRVFLLLFFLAFCWFAITNIIHKIQVNGKVDEIDKEKPGFKDFYTAWKSNQEKEASQLVGALALGAFLATGEEVVRRERLRSDVRIIKDEWRKP